MATDKAMLCEVYQGAAMRQHILGATCHGTGKPGLFPKIHDFLEKSRHTMVPGA